MKRNFQIAVFAMEMQFLVHGKLILDLCACPILTVLGLRTNTKPMARLGLGVFLQQEGFGELPCFPEN